MTTPAFLRTLREEFDKELSTETGWGRNEIKQALERSIANSLEMDDACDFSHVHAETCPMCDMPCDIEGKHTVCRCCDCGHEWKTPEDGHAVIKST